MHEVVFNPAEPPKKQKKEQRTRKNTRKHSKTDTHSTHKYRHEHDSCPARISINY